MDNLRHEVPRGRPMGFRGWRCHPLVGVCLKMSGMGEGGVLCSLLFGSNVYSVRFCMPAYLRYQGVGWNIVRKITCILHLGTDEN